MIYIRDNIYIEINYELVSVTVWNANQNQCVIDFPNYSFNVTWEGQFCREIIYANPYKAEYRHIPKDIGMPAMAVILLLNQCL